MATRAAGYTLEILQSDLAIVKLKPEDSVPRWAQGEFVAITKTATELSIVCAQSGIPDDVEAERGWTGFRLAGPLAFDQVGVIASITAPLDAAQVPIFVVSTYDTDYLLIKSDHLDSASEALTASGHRIVTSSSALVG
jgi:hypothetical protein